LANWACALSTWGGGALAGLGFDGRHDLLFDGLGDGGEGVCMILVQKLISPMKCEIRMVKMH
jgi:hypothetical protein